MTTPAVNINVALSGHANARLEVNGVVWDDYEISLPYAASARRIRPASISVPKRPDGTRPPTNWEHFGGRCNSPNVRVVTENPSSGYVWTHLGEISLIRAHDLVNEFDEEARQICKEQSQLKALSTFTERAAELGEALRQVGDTARTFAEFTRRTAHELDKLYDALKGRGYKGALDYLKKTGRDPSIGWRGIPDKYLAGLYGVMPIADDIAGGFDRLAEMREMGMQMKLTLKGKHKLQTRTPGRNIGSGYGFRLKATTVERVRATSSFVYTLPDWWFDELPTVSAFSENWNVLRMSFVVDWALPIGTWLQAVEAAQLSPFFTDGSTSVTSRIWFENVLTDASPYQVRYPAPRNVDAGAFWFQRFKYDTSTGVPSALTMRPRLKSPLSLGHVAQGLALLTGSMRKLLR